MSFLFNLSRVLDIWLCMVVDWVLSLTIPMLWQSIRKSGIWIISFQEQYAYFCWEMSVVSCLGSYFLMQWKDTSVGIMGGALTSSIYYLILAIKLVKGLVAFVFFKLQSWFSRRQVRFFLSNLIFVLMFWISNWDYDASKCIDCRHWRGIFLSLDKRNSRNLKTKLSALRKRFIP